jgi:hypothetical protein
MSRRQLIGKGSANASRNANLAHLRTAESATSAGRASATNQFVPMAGAAMRSVNGVRPMEKASTISCDAVSGWSSVVTGDRDGAPPSLVLASSGCIEGHWALPLAPSWRYPSAECRPSRPQCGRPRSSDIPAGLSRVALGEFPWKGTSVVARLRDVIPPIRAPSRVSEEHRGRRIR